MERTALIAEEQTPLDVGSLVSLSVNIGEPLPAMVAGGDERWIALQTASRPICKVGDRAVIGWSLGGELYELRTRVTRGHDITSQLMIARQGIITRTGDRRGAARFVLVAGGSLDGDTPPLGTHGALEVRDGLGVLLPRANVRVMHASETKQEGVARVGLAFDDPKRVAAATGRLLSLLG